MKREATSNQRPAAAREQLAMRPREAATALGISERLLWDWTRAEGLPHIRIGNVVLYPVDGLKQWLTHRAAIGPAPTGSSASDGSTGSVAAR